MADRAYWARLSQEPLKPSGRDHPLGFAYATLDGSVLPRLALLRSSLETQEQHDAFEEVMRALGYFCGQVRDCVEDGKAMTRALKELEDEVRYESRDLESVRARLREGPEYRHFDSETYKRAHEIGLDLKAIQPRSQIEWEHYESKGRDLNEQVSEWRARGGR